MIRHNPDKMYIPNKVAVKKMAVPVLESTALRAAVYSEYRKMDPSDTIHANQLLGRPLKGKDLNPTLLT